MEGRLKQGKLRKDKTVFKNGEGNEIQGMTM